MDSNGKVSLTSGQKALKALRLREQGVPVDEAVKQAGSTERQLQAAAAVLRKMPDMESGLASGEVTLNAAQVAAGYRTHKQVHGRAFGKGDKWLEVANTLMQYLNGWKARDYKFTHIPPKEAENRVKVIDEAIAGLEAVKADLVERSVRATSALKTH